jgi:hypothetical protein
MRIRNLLIAILTVSSTVAFAQEQRQIKEEGKTVFKPHWFMQVQAGAAHSRRSRFYRSDLSGSSCQCRV